jgi:hypothetical protein
LPHGEHAGRNGPFALDPYPAFATCAISPTRCVYFETSIPEYMQKEAITICYDSANFSFTVYFNLINHI